MLEAADVLERELDEPEAARDLLERCAMACDPECIEALERCARAWVDAGEEERAAGIFARARARYEWAASGASPARPFRSSRISRSAPRDGVRIIRPHRGGRGCPRLPPGCPRRPHGGACARALLPFWPHDMDARTRRRQRRRDRTPGFPPTRSAGFEACSPRDLEASASASRKSGSRRALRAWSYRAAPSSWVSRTVALPSSAKAAARPLSSRPVH